MPNAFRAPVTSLLISSKVTSAESSDSESEVSSSSSSSSSAEAGLSSTDLRGDKARWSVPICSRFKKGRRASTHSKDEVIDNLSPSSSSYFKTTEDRSVYGKRPLRIFCSSSKDVVAGLSMRMRLTSSSPFLILRIRACCACWSCIDCCLVSKKKLCFGFFYTFYQDSQHIVSCLPANAVAAFGPSATPEFVFTSCCTSICLQKNISKNL